MSISIDLDTSDFDSALPRVINATKDYPRAVIATLTPIVEEEFIRTVPVDSGDMRNSITSSFTDGFGIVKTNTAKFEGGGYAKAVDQGRGAVTIRAKGKAFGGADFLRFVIDGQEIFRKEVRQKARAGQFFVDKTIKNVTPQVGAVMRQMWNEMV